MYEFVLRNIVNQNKHKNVKIYLLLTNEGKKTEKKTENSQNSSRVDGCYGNVIDTGKFSLINFRKSHEIW